MRTIAYKITAMAVLLLCGMAALARQTATVVMKDGSKFTGDIVAQRPGKDITVEATRAVLAISEAEIRSRKEKRTKYEDLAREWKRWALEEDRLQGDAYGRSVLNFAGQFKVLVNAWRKTLENENLHFYWVQLTSYSGNPCWPAARWAQLAVRDSIPLSGVVNTIDLGELNDIHPKDKTSVASRLEKLVLRNVYGMKNVHARAPELKSVKYGENFAEIVFSDFGRGLVGRGKPRGFEVLSGGEWRNAVASLDGLKVVVKSPDGGAVDVAQEACRRVGVGLPEV